MTPDVESEPERLDQALHNTAELLRQVLDGMGEAFGLMDRDFRIITQNQAALDMDGRPLDEIRGRTHWDVYPGSEESEIGALYKRALAQNVPVSLEHRYEWADGHAKWLEMRAYPVPEGLAVFWHDITDRKDAEAVLRASEVKYRTLFENMGQGYALGEVIRDQDGRAVDLRYLELNPAFERLSGIPVAQAQGRTVREVYGTVEPEWFEVAERVARLKVPERVEYEIGAIGRWFQMHFYPAEGDRYLGLYEDVTARKHAEVAQRKSEERQAFLLELSDALRELADPIAIEEQATRLLARQLNVSRVVYATFVVEGGREYVVIEREHRAPETPSLVGRHLAEASTEDIDSLRAGRATVIPDIEVEPMSDERRAGWRALGARARMGIPLVKGGRLAVVLGVQDTAPRAWTSEDVALVAEVAERTWASVERARAEAALRDSEERLRMALEAGRMGTWRFDLATGRQEWSEQQFKLYGLAPSKIPPTRDLFLSLVHPEDHHLIEFGPEDLLPDRGLLDAEFRIVRPDGEIRWLVAHTVVRRDDANEPVEMIGLNWDITDRKLAEVTLRESEERFRQFAEASADALWIRDAETYAFEYVSPAIETIFGVSSAQVLGDARLINALIVPEERDAVSERVARVSSGETITQEYRIKRASDGAFRWVRSTGFPLRDGAAKIGRIAAIATDVSEARQLADHRSVLLAELQHRVRNIMGMIRSIANRSATGATGIRDYRTILEGRLLAISRVQALLTREANAGGSLREVIRSEISAQAHRDEQFELTGPDITLSPKAVEVLTLAFHELTTNALKYGGLSGADGRISVRWTPFDKRGESWLKIDWVEDGAPSRPPSERRGFGSELIEARIPYELGGTGKVTIEAKGARCEIAFPLSNAESILETDAPTPTTVFGGSIDMTGAPDLTGQIVLVVEDDYYLASDTAAALSGAGAKVLGPYPRVEATKRALVQATPTAAVVDLNLGGGGPQFEVAYLLKERGVPFVFLTGYDPDVVPDDLADVVRLQKPIPLREVVDAVAAL